MSKSKFMVRLDSRVEDERNLAELYENTLPGRKHDVILELLITGYRAKYGDVKPKLIGQEEAPRQERQQRSKEEASNGHHKHTSANADQGKGSGLVELLGEQSLTN